MKTLLVLTLSTLLAGPVLAGGLWLQAPNGKYLGNLNSNPFDPNSVANPFGRYGSQFSPDSINNGFGRYGSPFSPDSATNPFTSGGPRIMGDDD
ncbi:MAG TPA: hypothetical protein VKV41_25400 [Methylomirabilota bacterium]|nr:hypothetical protein [Methylomirabilota bacterium]